TGREVARAGHTAAPALNPGTARGRLGGRGKPYYRSLEPGLHLGYRRPLSGPGKWVARHYIGDQSYQLEVIGTADDFSDADGVRILSYRQAQALAPEAAAPPAHLSAGKHGPPPEADPLEAPFEFQQPHTRHQ